MRADLSFPVQQFLTESPRSWAEGPGAARAAQRAGLTGAADGGYRGED